MKTSVRNILVRAPNWIGDLVLALDFARALRSSYPGIPVTWLVPESLSEWAQQLDIGNVRALRNEEKRFPGGVYRLGVALKNERFDLGISLTASVSSAALLYWSGIRHRVGYAEPLAAPWLTQSLRWPKNENGRHKSDVYFDLLKWLRGMEVPKPTGFAQESVREAVGLVAPGASIPLRQWPHFAELLVRLNERFPEMSWKVVGGKGESSWHSRLAALNLPRTEDWVEKTSLSELQALCARSRVVIANDSGVAHLAATVAATPTVVVFGPGDPAYVRPIGPAVHVVRVDHLACSPCESRHCRGAFGYQTCLKTLKTEPVFEKVRSILQG